MEKSKYDRFYVYMLMRSFLEPHKMIKARMLYDTGAQVSTISRETLDGLGFYALLDKFQQDRHNYYEKLPQMRRSGGLKSASGHIMHTAKVQIKEMELLKGENPVIKIKSNGIFFDFNTEPEGSCNNILGLDLIKYFDSTIMTHNGITLLKMNLADFAKFDNNLIRNYTEKSGNSDALTQSIDIINYIIDSENQNKSSYEGSLEKGLFDNDIGSIF